MSVLEAQRRGAVALFYYWYADEAPVLACQCNLQQVSFIGTCTISLPFFYVYCHTICGGNSLMGSAELEARCFGPFRWSPQTSISLRPPLSPSILIMMENT